MGTARWGVLMMVAGCGSSSVASGPSDAGAADAVVDSTTDANGGDAADDPWSCVGRVTYPTPTTATVHVRYRAIALGGAAVAGVEVRACPDATDSSCAGSIDVQTTDANGDCNFTLPTGSRGFDGYFEATVTGDITLLNFVAPPFWADRPDYQRVQWYGPQLRSLASTAGITLDTTRGHVGIEAHNCFSHNLQGVLDVRAVTLASGLTFDLSPPDPTAKFVYVRGNAFESTDPSTDNTGTAGILNVAPGVYTLTTKLAATGQRVGSNRISIRPGVFSMVTTFPAP